MPKRKSRREKETAYQNIVAWDGDGYISGVIKFTPEFLEELLDRFDEGDELVYEEYKGDERIVVSFSLNESDYDSIDWYGNVRIKEPKKKKTKRRSRSRYDDGDN